MASVHTTLVKNDASQALFEIAKGDTPFTVDTRIAYSGDSQSAIVLNALDYAKGDEKVTFSGGQFQLDADRDGKNISLKGQAGSGQIDALNEYNQKVQLRFVNLTTDAATELASFNERIGQQKMTLDKLAISVEGKELALIDGMALDGGSTLTQDGKGVNSQVNYTVNSLKLQGQDMGSGKLTLKVDNVDGQAQTSSVSSTARSLRRCWRNRSWRRIRSCISRPSPKRCSMRCRSCSKATRR